ncbi:MAG: OmpA family protein [Candidatus Scalindua sp.]
MSDGADVQERVGTGERDLVKDAAKSISKLFKRKKPKDKPPIVDMLSFASIMTILLAFFIMLSSHAGKPEHNATKEAVESFQNALEAFGLSRIVYGRSNSIANLAFVSKKSGVKSDNEDTKIVGRSFANMINGEIDIEYVQKGRRMFFPTNIDFVDGGTELLPSSKAYLDNLAKLIKDRDCKVIVCSYTDEGFVPTVEHPTDWQFTAERSSAVANYLYNGGNINYKRIIAIGYGEHQPLLGEEASFNAGENSRTNIIISNGELW